MAYQFDSLYPGSGLSSVMSLGLPPGNFVKPKLTVGGGESRGF